MNDISDLISREEAAKRLEAQAEKWKGSFSGGAFAFSAKIVRGVPSAVRWIPASEPPKEDGTYIVKTASGTVTTARFYAFKSFPATKHLPALHRSPQWQSNRNVVKWMPLPEGE